MHPPMTFYAIIKKYKDVDIIGMNAITFYRRSYHEINTFAIIF